MYRSLAFVEIERMNSKRIDKLEKQVHYQKWGLIVLMSLFLFTSTPGITEITQRVLLPKELLTESLSGIYSQKTIGDVPESPLRVTPAKKIAQAAGDILTVSQINVVDAIGRTLAQIGSDSDGNGGIWLYNLKGNVVMWLGSDQNLHGALTASTSNEVTVATIQSVVDEEDQNIVTGRVTVQGSGDSAATLGADEFGDGYTAVFNRQGQVVAYQGIDRLGNGNILAYNKQGETIASIGASSEGTGYLSVFERGNLVANLAAFKDVGGGLRLTNKNGRTVVALGPSIGNTGVISVISTTGEPRAIALIGADSVDSGLLAVLDATGEPTALMTNRYLGIAEHQFEAYIDDNGNGVVETRSANGDIRWSSETVVQPSGLLGDLDGDGDVDFNDFLAFAQNFGKEGG